MRQQIIRVIDPNFKHAIAKNYSEDGKRLISLMRVRGVEKEVRDEMRVYLAAREKVFKRTSMHKEMTRSGHPSLALAFGAESVGIFNPDTIPIDTYTRMKMDPQVAIGLAMIKMPLYSLGWVVECEDNDIKEFVKEALQKVWRRLIRSTLTSIDFGFASHELVWELRDMNVFTQAANGRKKTHFSGNAEVYKKIKPHYPGSIKIRTDSKTDEFLGIVQQVGGGGEQIKLDADKCFLFTTGDEFGNLFGQSRLKPAYKPWYWKEILTQFMLRYFERKGSPNTIVTHPIGGGLDASGTEYDNTEIALRIGQNLTENSVVTLPYEGNREGRNMWEANFLADDKRGEMFVNALNYLGTQILRALLTPERVMTQDLSTGSFSMAQSHAEIFLLSEEGLTSEVEDAVNERIIPPLVQFNFQPNKVLPCRVKIEKIQYDRRRILKEILVEIIRNVNTWAKAGISPSILPSMKEMSKILGVPLTIFEEEYAQDSSLITSGPGGAPPDEGGRRDDDKGGTKDSSTAAPAKSKGAKVTRLPVKQKPVNE